MLLGANSLVAVVLKGFIVITIISGDSSVFYAVLFCVCPWMMENMEIASFAVDFDSK